MAVLLGFISRSAGGGSVNARLSSSFDRFAANQIVGWPPSARLISATNLGEPVADWPVEAHGRVIAGVLATTYSDDYYHRIHISPSVLNLGNLVSTQTTEVFLWNAYLNSQQLIAIDGVEEGILVVGQPALPLNFPGLRELTWQLSVTPSGQPVLDAVIAWRFSNGDVAGLRVTANRIIAWTFAPDWGDGVTEKLGFATDVLQSESAKEQRRGLRQAPRRELEAPMYVEGRERQLLDLALHGWSARTWALPIWHEIQLLDGVVPVGAMSISCSTQYLDFRDGGLAMLRGESAFASETVEIEEVTAGGLQLKRGTQQAWQRGTRLYPVRNAVLQEQPSLTRLTDQAISAEVRFLIVEACSWPGLMPGTLYKGWPVYDARPDESEDLSSTLSRLQLSLDNGSAIPLFTDTANRGLAVLAHRWIDLGRAARASVRSFIYAMRGRQKAVWLPTHADDMTLIDVITATAVTIDIAHIGYTRFSNGKPGRRDIRIELFDGTVFFRRITGSTELTMEIERLALESSLGRQVSPAQVMRISWMVLCRFDSDTQVLKHMTDSEGVAAWATTFREVRDES